LHIPTRTNSGENAETRKEGGPGASSWHAQDARRRRACFAAVVFLATVGLYAALQAYSYRHLATPGMLDPRVAKASVLVSLFGWTVVAVYFVLLCLPIAGGKGRPRVYYASTLTMLLLQVCVWLTHIYLNGSQNTVGHFVIPVIAMVASWLLSWREAVALFLLANAGLLAIMTLEHLHVLPYAPLLLAFRESSRLFLSWQIMVGNTVTYLVLAVFFLVTSYFFQRVILQNYRRLGESHRLLEAEVQEHRQTEGALRRSEQRYKAILDHARDVIYTVSPEGRITSLSPSFEDSTGWSRDEWLGRSVEGILHPEDWSRALDMGMRCLKGEKAPVHELRIRTRSFGYAPYEFSITRQQEGAGLAGIVGIGRNLRERKEMEEKLRQAQRLESLGILAGGIAHDLNNILTPILVNVSAARRYGRLEDELADLLTDAEKAGSRARNLTQQLLSFSKGGTPSIRAVLIADLLRDTASLALSGSRARVALSLAEDLWRVSADESQIGQVVQNLLINADQAMPTGGTIALSAENVRVGPGQALPLSEGDYVKISITDHGVGIPAERLRRIFDPFYTTRANGTGLGLAISFSIIQRHRGTIQVESEPGNGTSFHLYLPALRECPGQESRDAPAGSA